MLAAIVIAVWMIIWKFFDGKNTLALPGREHTDLHEHLTSFRDSVLASRDTNPIIQATYQIGSWATSAFEWFSRLISVPDFPRPVPQVGWLGVLAAATWIGYAVANWRIALLVAASFARVRRLRLLVGQRGPAGHHLHRGADRRPHRRPVRRSTTAPAARSASE